MGKVVLIACTNVGRSMIEAIKNSHNLKDKVELVGVVNLNIEVAINKANYDSYADLIKKYDLNLYYCNNVNEEACVEFLHSCQPDIIIQSGWSQKFKKKVLQIPTYACIGEHPAPLPKGRGAACINWAIITGECEWGDTFFKMEMEYDTGVIFSQEYFNIEIYDDVKTVYDKVARASVDAIEKHLIDWTEGRLNGKKQEDSASTHYPRRNPSDGELDFSKSAIEIYNAIRGQTKPYPGAFFVGKDGKKIYIWKARIGDVIAPCEVKMLCGDGEGIIVQRMQREGKPEMWASDFYKENPHAFNGKSSEALVVS